MKTEKEWVTEAGLKAQVVATPMGHRCGYVGVPAGHPMFGKHYDDVEVAVHGGLTYSEEDEGLWCFGYDCGHWDDAKDPEIMSDEMKKRFNRWTDTGGTIKTLEFCVAECEALAKQLEEMK
jgi:hypothetical protein